jgi:hypothetical protein
MPRFVFFMTIIAAFLSVPAAYALDFRLEPVRIDNCRQNCPMVIVAEGEIYVDDQIRLRRMFNSARDDQTILPIMLIHSPGGQAGGGFQLAYIARALKLTVVVGRPYGDAGIAPGLCASACTFVLSGGVKRIASPGSVVAVHSGGEPPPFYDARTGTFEPRPKLDKSELNKTFRQFFRSMGVNTKIVDIMDKTPFEDGYVLSPKQLRALRLTNANSL